MLTEKYSEKFLEIYDKFNNMGAIINGVIETEKETNIEMLDWEDEQVIIFLKQFGSVAPSSLHKKIQIIRKFADMICKKEKLPLKEYSLNDGVTMQLIDRKRLFAVTLTYEQFMNIKNQLDIQEDGMNINVRDKVIFELAWEGLTSDDIRLLKESDIEITKEETGLNVAILNLKDRIARIDSQEMIEDIKACMKETYSVSVNAVGKRRQLPYKNSEYLCKPSKIGKESIKTYLNEPNIALQGVFKSGAILCEGIEVEGLSLADIRRSKLIYLLAPENVKYFDTEIVSSIFNLRSNTGLNWLRTIAAEMYPLEG